MGKSSCPSQTALEEYAVALSVGAPEPAVLNHVKACKRCKDHLKKLQRESDSFLGFLRSAKSSPSSPCPGATVLAAYLDKALDPDDRNKIEQHLAVCRPCQQVVIDIYKETGASGARETEAAYAPVPVVLADQKPAKPRPGPNVMAEGSLVGDTADAEPRKKRLSSDFD